MMKAGTETGSLTNHLYSRLGGCLAPEVGMGATILQWTDRQAGTIVKLTPHQIHVQHDAVTRVGPIKMSEAQQYTYAPNPTAPIDVFRRTKRGWKNSAGNHLLIGTRDQYHDYSF